MTVNYHYQFFIWEYLALKFIVTTDVTIVLSRENYLAN